ncbi:MAG: glycosyltransferase family 2 protein [Actinomycetota bacterium]
MGGNQPEQDVIPAAEAESPVPAPPTVTVVVPVYNEADYLPAAIPALTDALGQLEAEVRILVVENGSTDGSADIVRSFQADHEQLDLLQLPTANYGAAIRAGFDAVRTDWAVVFDIDYFSGPFLAAALAERDRADLVIGSKRAPGSDDRRAPVRRMATWSLNTLLRVLVGLRVSDTHGMKAIRREVLDAVLADVVSVDDLFDTEVVIRAERLGFRIVELPVVVEEQRESKSKIWHRVPRTLRGILRIRRSL